MNRDPRFLKKDNVTQEMLDTIQRLAKIAEERGQSLAQMAIAWVLKNPCVTSALIGASRPSQIYENVKALEHLDFTEEENREIEKILGK